MHTFDTSRFCRFSDAYLAGLTKAVETTEDYAYGVKDVPTVHARMMRALTEGAFNHGGAGFKNACKALGIKHTRKAIFAFLEGV